MIGSTKRVPSSHVPYHFVFTTAACTDLYRHFWLSKMPQASSIVGRHKTGCSDQKWRLECSVDHRFPSIICARHRWNKKKTKIISGKNAARKSFLSLYQNSKSPVGSQSCVAGLPWKKTLVGNPYGRHGNSPSITSSFSLRAQAVVFSTTVFRCFAVTADALLRSLLLLLLMWWLHWLLLLWQASVLRGGECSHCVVWSVSLPFSFPISHPLPLRPGSGSLQSYPDREPVRLLFWLLATFVDGPARRPQVWSAVYTDPPCISPPCVSVRHVIFFVRRIRFLLRFNAFLFRCHLFFSFVPFQGFNFSSFFSLAPPKPFPLSPVFFTPPELPILSLAPPEPSLLSLAPPEPFLFFLSLSLSLSLLLSSLAPLALSSPPVFFLRRIGKVKCNMWHEDASEMTQNEVTTTHTEARRDGRASAQNSFFEHLDGRTQRSWRNVCSGGLRKPRVVMWMTRAFHVNGHISPKLPPFLILIVWRVPLPDDGRRKLSSRDGREASWLQRGGREPKLRVAALISTRDAKRVVGDFEGTMDTNLPLVLGPQWFT